jgi:SAM-dependent methyltransferase
MRYGISYLGSAFPLRVAGLSNSARAWGFWMICSMTAVHASSCWIIATPYIRERARPMSTRCRHVLWSPEGLARLHAEPPSYDWFIALAVFWHVEDSTAAALIRELGKLLKPGGYVLIHGWNSATPEKVREMSAQHRLFDSYPTYVLNLDLLQETLEPDYQELCRETILLYRKRELRDAKVSAA